MKQIFNLATAIFGSIAAIFWILSARVKIPPVDESLDTPVSHDRQYVAILQSSRWNFYAASFSAISAFCAAAGVFL